MKKVISILMILAILFSFTGCDESSKNSNSTVTSTVGTQKPNETSTAESTLNSPTATSEPEETIDIVATSSLSPEISNQPTMSATQETPAPVATSKPTPANTATAKPTATAVATEFPTAIPTPTATSYLNVGDTITFGKYEQDNNTSNGKEDVEWIVLAKEDNRILVTSKNALDYQPYNIDSADVTWENCTLRMWLNDTFINNAFTSSEQGKILTVNVIAEETLWGTDSGNDTQDKVFVLSISEVSKYFSSEKSRLCIATDYVKAQGANVSSITGVCDWWLRSPGDMQHLASVVMSGWLNDIGIEVSFKFGIRPAMWIELG